MSTIATLPHSQLPAVPEIVRRLRGLDTHSFDVPLDATCWIACDSAKPHIDPAWANQLFLTLTVEADGHEFGDAEIVKQEIGYSITRPGDIFIVDPMCPHWMLHSGKPSKWIGLQWEIPRRTARKHAQLIVAKIGAVWRTAADARYTNYAPTP